MRRPGHRNPNAGSRAIIEPLEPRQLLNSGPVLIGDTPDADAKSLVYTDNDGTVANVAFKSGCIAVGFDREDAEWTVANGRAVVDGPVDVGLVTLLDSSPASTLKFKTSAPGGEDSEADEYVCVEGIIGEDVGLGRLLADKVEIGLVGIDIDLGVTLCRIADATGVALDFGQGPKMTFMAEWIDSADLLFSGSIGLVKVDEWCSGRIAAGAVGKVIAKGHFEADVESQSFIGDIKCRELYGDLIAHNGDIGNITVKGVAVTGEEAEDGYFDGGNIFSEQIRASGSIGDITLIGGGIGTEDTCAITAETGSIGDITAKAGKYRAPREDYPWWWPEERVKWETYYSQSDIGDVEVEAPGGIGAITVIGGYCGGEFRTAGNIGDVTVRAITDRTHGQFVGGGFYSLLVGECIGDIRVRGGAYAGIAAIKRLGNITIQAQSVKVDPESTSWEYDQSWDGMILRDSVPMRLVLWLGVPHWQGPNHMGAIRLTGAAMTLEGELYDLSGKLDIISRPVRNVMAYSEADDDFVYFDQFGGPDQLTNNLSLLTNEQPSWTASSGNSGSGYSLTIVTFSGFTSGDSEVGYLADETGNLTVWNQGDYSGDGAV